MAMNLPWSQVGPSNLAGTAAAPGEPASLAFNSAARIQQSLSSRLERRLLEWLAERMPSWINSDHLTLVGSVSMLLAGVGYAFTRWNRVGLVVATLGLALNWFGDSLDGTLARVRNRQRPRYGFYVDHMIDTFGAFFLMGGLAVSGIIDGRMAVAILIAFLMLSIETYLATYTLGTFRLSFWKFGPTEIRMLLALGNVTLWLHPGLRVLGSRYRLFDVGSFVAVTAMTLVLIVASVWHAAKLYREETRPVGRSGAAGQSGSTLGVHSP